MNFTILRFDELGSTNTEALKQARRGADEGLCVVARRQTAGRGRHGRVWISEADAGLYFSVVLRPNIETRFTPLITLMTAVTIYDLLIELYKLKPDIKWANDVHIGDKKICGILAEMTETARGSAIVVGIGVNLKSANFPPELKESATSIEEEINQTPDIEITLRCLTRLFDKFYERLNGADGAAEIRAEWEKRSSYARGKNVRVTLEGETFAGTTRGIEADGALRVETGDGAVKIVRAGDVERLRKVEENRTD